MTISASILRKLSAANLAPEQMAVVLDILAEQVEAVEARKAAQRERVRRHRESKRHGNDDVTLHDDHPLSPKERSPTPPKEITPIPLRCDARDPIDGRIGEMLDALGITDETKTPGLLVLSEPYNWVSNGCDIDADILPTLRSFAARGKPVRSWAYCTDAVFEARDRRLKPAPAIQQRAGTGPPPKQTVAQQARDEIKRRMLSDAPSTPDGYHDQGDRISGFAGTGIARRLAIAAGG